jgi:hypothetical protein
MMPVTEIDFAGAHIADIKHTGDTIVIHADNVALGVLTEGYLRVTISGVMSVEIDGAPADTLTAEGDHADILSWRHDLGHLTLELDWLRYQPRTLQRRTYRIACAEVTAERLEPPL